MWKGVGVGVGVGVMWNGTLVCCFAHCESHALLPSLWPGADGLCVSIDSAYYILRSSILESWHAKTRH